MFYASRFGEGLANSDIAALKVAVIDCEDAREAIRP